MPVLSQAVPGDGQELLAVKGFSPLSDAVEDIDEAETQAA
jgi:hypothetical protein